MAEAAPTRPLTVAIVEDEPLSRARLHRLLGHFEQVRCVGAFPSGRALIEAWPSQAADVLLLDIRMPGLDGFQTLARLTPKPRVVFTTAHAEFAVEAFDVAAVDYLLKPISLDRLRRSIDRLCRADSAVSAPPERLALRLGRRVSLVEPGRIEWVKVQANYVEIAAGGQRWVLKQTLQETLRQLDPAQFVRVHRSWVVRVDAVVEVVALTPGRYRLLLADGTRIDSGRGQRNAVRAALGLSGRMVPPA